MQIEETYTGYDLNESRNRTRPGLIRRLMARLIDYQMILIFFLFTDFLADGLIMGCLLYTSPSPRDRG